jgi:hypothetical protein
MKRFEATYKDNGKNNHILDEKGSVWATEVRFDIIAESEKRALELIEQEGENPNDFELSEISGVKDQMGRFFSESIRDARI